MKDLIGSLTKDIPTSRESIQWVKEKIMESFEYLWEVFSKTRLHKDSPKIIIIRNIIKWSVDSLETSTWELDITIIFNTLSNIGQLKFIILYLNMFILIEIAFQLEPAQNN